MWRILTASFGAGRVSGHRMIDVIPPADAGRGGARQAGSGHHGPFGPLRTLISRTGSGAPCRYR
jgi:hypothetical protein